MQLVRFPPTWVTDRYSRALEEAQRTLGPLPGSAPQVAPPPIEDRVELSPEGRRLGASQPAIAPLFPNLDQPPTAERARLATFERQAQIRLQPAAVSPAAETPMQTVATSAAPPPLQPGSLLAGPAEVPARPVPGQPPPDEQTLAITRRQAVGVRMPGAQLQPMVPERATVLAPPTGPMSGTPTIAGSPPPLFPVGTQAGAAGVDEQAPTAFAGPPRPATGSLVQTAEPAAAMATARRRPGVPNQPFAGPDLLAVEPTDGAISGAVTRPTFGPDPALAAPASGGQPSVFLTPGAVAGRPATGTSPSTAAVRVGEAVARPTAPGEAAERLDPVIAGRQAGGVGLSKPLAEGNGLQPVEGPVTARFQGLRTAPEWQAAPGSEPMPSLTATAANPRAAEAPDSPTRLVEAPFAAPVPSALGAVVERGAASPLAGPRETATTRSGSEEPQAAAPVPRGAADQAARAEGPLSSFTSFLARQALSAYQQARQTVSTVDPGMPMPRTFDIAF
jgi:hypothetical protein